MRRISLLTRSLVVLGGLMFGPAAPAAAGPSCPVLVLNGTNRYATTSATIYPNSTTLVSFTAEAWIRPGTLPSDHNSQIIVSDDAYDLILNYVPASGLVRLIAQLWGASGVTQSTYFDYRSVSLNQWHHVALTFDAGTKRLWIVLDGNVGSAFAVTHTNFATFASNFLVGSYPTSGAFNGFIDEVRVSNGARYTSNFTPPDTLAADANTRALYHFNEAAGSTTFADGSGNGNTLTGINGAQTGNSGGCTAVPAPTVTAIQPTTGSTAGSTAVTISGTNFVTGAAVSMGGSAATNVIVVNATTITATTPAHAAGAVNVVVTNPDTQSGTLTNGYTYIDLVTAERIAFGLTAIGSDGGWIATRSGAGSSYEARPWTRLPWSTYNATGRGTHVAAGDVDGDGRDELVIGLESGGNGWLAVLDDAANNFALLKWIQVPWSTYNAANGEVWPAVGDVDHDGRAEIVAGLGKGAAGWFAIFDDAAGGYALIRWNRVDWAAYNAGDGRTYPAVGNVNGAGGAEIIVGLGPGSNGWIEVFGSSASSYSHLAWMQLPWPAYNAANGETHVAAGDVDGDGRAEIVAGLGGGGGGWLHIFDDANASYASLAWRRISWAGYSSDAARGHTYPAVGDLDGDAGAEIVIGLAPYPDTGGWFEVLDDNGMSNASRGWRNVGWPAYTAAGGGLFPAVGRFR